MEKLIQASRSIVIAADVATLGELETLVRSVKGVEGISGFKLGFRLAWRNLELAVNIIREYYGSGAVIIYDHQKGGTDIPEMGESFVKDLKAIGINAAILFPFTGPETQKKWTEACFSAELPVIIGGIMTHPNFLVSEGGYIDDTAPACIFRLACDMEVQNFVVPATKLEWVVALKSILSHRLGEKHYTIFSPGFITQGGNLFKFKSLMGTTSWHGIIGRAIYKAVNIREAAENIVKKVVLE